MTLMFELDLDTTSRPYDPAHKISRPKVISFESYCSHTYADAQVDGDNNN